MRHATRYMCNPLGRRWLRLAILILAASVLAVGCASEVKNTVEAVGGESLSPLIPAGSPAAISEIEESRAVEPPNSGTPSSTSSGSGSRQPLSSAPPPFPGETEGEQTTGGLVDDSSTGPDGPDGPGGLLLLPDSGPGLWSQVADEVYDLCDDLEAFVAATGRVLGPGDEITEADRIQIEIMRSGDEVDCDTPGGNRYSYVSEDVRWPARPTGAEAAVQYNAMRDRGADRRKAFPPGLLLGYYGLFVRQFPLIERDAVVVLEDSVTVRDGNVRGLVHNLSETQYAREVTVTARGSQSDGTANADSDVVGSWKWPLTVQPGERAPFEITGWTGGSDPESVTLQVTASLSAQVDFKRSFGPIVREYWPADEEDYRRIVPSYAIGSESIPAYEFGFTEVTGRLRLPNSDPEVIEQMTGIVIEDPRMYFALLDIEMKVIDVFERATYASFDTGHMRINNLPTRYEDGPGDPVVVLSMTASIIPGTYRWQVWMGGANPSPAQQSGEQTMG